METRDIYESRNSLNGDFGFSIASDRRFAFSRQASFQQTQEPHTPISIDRNDSGRPFLSRSDSSIEIPREFYWSAEIKGSLEKFSFSSFIWTVFRNIRSGHRYMKRLFLLISLNVAYSTAELLIGFFTGRIGNTISFY